MNEILAELGRSGIVPVIKIEQEEHAIPLGEALLAGGLPCAEITLRTEAGLGAIGRIAAALPRVLVGAGTVLSVEQAERAVASGARFVVSPGFDPDVVDWCMQHQIVCLPGVVTPTEINMALKKGLRVLKFFPAEASGGPAMLKALADPYSGIRFIPTGGINPSNLPDYLRLGNVLACGGSWMVPAPSIARGEFGEITRLVAESREIVRQARGSSAP